MFLPTKIALPTKIKIAESDTERKSQPAQKFQRKSFGRRPVVQKSSALDGSSHPRQSAADAERKNHFFIGQARTKVIMNRIEYLESGKSRSRDSELHFGADQRVGITGASTQHGRHGAGGHGRSPGAPPAREN